MQSYEEAVLKVVMWWSDNSFRKPLNQNNGGDDVTHVLMNTLSMKVQEKISQEQIKKFEIRLTQLLMSPGLKKWEKSLSVDYSPCKKLFEAAEFAGIKPYCFPCKSSTRIDDDNNAYGYLGYGASEVKL